MGWILSALLLLVAALPASAQQFNNGAILSLGLTIGTQAKTLCVSGCDNSYAHMPTTYLQICNDAASGGNNIGIRPDATAAAIATAGNPTHTLFPGGCQTFESNQVPTNTWSIIASGSSTPVTVWYR